MFEKLILSLNFIKAENVLGQPVLRMIKAFPALEINMEFMPCR